MDAIHPLREAIRLVGLFKLARELGISHQALSKWLKVGRMPRTEWSGETAYSEAIERLTAGAVTKSALLAAWPRDESDKRLAA